MKAFGGNALTVSASIAVFVALVGCSSHRASAGGGKPIQGAAPAGSVPADFVGTWKYTGANRADDLTFNTDGTASPKQLETSSIAVCASSIAFEYQRTVVFTPAKDAFTFYITTASSTANRAGSRRPCRRRPAPSTSPSRQFPPSVSAFNAVTSSISHSDARIGATRNPTGRGSE